MRGTEKRPKKKGRKKRAVTMPVELVTTPPAADATRPSKQGDLEAVVRLIVRIIRTEGINRIIISDSGEATFERVTVDKLSV
jgi:hypothetical protein